MEKCQTSGKSNPAYVLSTASEQRGMDAVSLGHCSGVVLFGLMSLIFLFSVEVFLPQAFY